MRYFLDPFGCVKNQVDSENMMAHLDKAGWENTSDAGLADLIIVNSCGFIETAKQESINAVLGWRKIYPDKKILLAGCLAQRYAKELPEIMPEADGFLGIDSPAQIAQTASAIVNGEKAANPKSVSAPLIPAGERPLLSLPGSAYVKISEGCNNRCSFCAIPLIRGSLVSRTIPDILDECHALLKRGIKELIIIGQDIGSFQTETSGAAAQSAALRSTAPQSTALQPTAKLPELLDAISSLEGHFWARLLYIHPDHFPLRILDIMEKDTRFLPYFDIPFQHASSKILAAMNRKGTDEKYLALLETIRRRLPRAVIRSTFLLGFPGETDEDFAALLDFQEKAKLDWLGCFTYSREEGTAACSMKRRVSAKTAAAHKRAVEEKQAPITEKNMERFVGQTLEVLIEERLESAAEDGENFLLGRLYCQAPDIDGSTVIVGGAGGESPRIGNFAGCKVIACRGFDLEAELL